MFAQNEPISPHIYGKTTESLLKDKEVYIERLEKAIRKLYEMNMEEFIKYGDLPLKEYNEKKVELALERYKCLLLVEIVWSNLGMFFMIRPKP